MLQVTCDVTCDACSAAACTMHVSRACLRLRAQRCKLSHSFARARVHCMLQQMMFKTACIIVVQTARKSLEQREDFGGKLAESKPGWPPDVCCAASKDAPVGGLLSVVVVVGGGRGGFCTKSTVFVAHSLFRPVTRDV